MDKKDDLFYKQVEEKLVELQQLPPTKEKKSRSEWISQIFSFTLGLVILIGLIFTVLGLLGRR